MRKSCIPYIPYRSLLLSTIVLNDRHKFQVRILQTYYTDKMQKRSTYSYMYVIHIYFTEFHDYVHT